MADSRVAVTGLGIICGLGRDQREFWARATEGQCGIRKLSLFDATGCLSDLASQVDDPQPPPIWPALSAGARRAPTCSA